MRGGFNRYIGPGAGEKRRRLLISEGPHSLSNKRFILILKNYFQLFQFIQKNNFVKYTWTSEFWSCSALQIFIVYIGVIWYSDKNMTAKIGWNRTGKYNVIEPAVQQDPTIYLVIRLNRIGDLMVSVLTLSVVDRKFEPPSGQTKNYKIGICR